MPEVITRVFKKLRRRIHGSYFAKQNFQCCNNCAVANIPSECDKFVFYHQQDTEDIKAHGYVYLSWSGDGEHIQDLFESEGVKCEWDGNEHSRAPH